MKQTPNTAEYKKHFSDAFLQIAKPYSGAASHNETPANLVLGKIISNPLCS